MNSKNDSINHALEALDHFGQNMQGGELLLRHVETLRTGIKLLQADKKAAAFETMAMAECVRHHPEHSGDWGDQLVNLSKRLGYRHEDQDAQHEAIDF
jgi:hypothetical protein